MNTPLPAVNVGVFDDNYDANRAVHELHRPASPAELFMVKGNGKGQEPTKLEYDFTNVMIESIQWSGSSGNIPVESVSFAFGDFDIDYLPTSSTPGSGSTNKPSTASWDLGQVSST